MVLPGAGPDAGQQLVVLLHQRPDQRTVVLGQQRQKVFKRRIGRGSNGASHVGPAQFAFTTGFLDEGGLTFDGGRAVQYAFSISPKDCFLLLI